VIIQVINSLLLLGCSESNFVFFMKMKDDFLIVNKYFIELYNVHSGPVPFAIFLAVA